MALETLKGISQIGGFPVLEARPTKPNGEVDWDAFNELRKAKPIYVDHDVNMISFRIQNGPIKEHGVNGCQVDTLIHAAKQMLLGLNEKFPSDYNCNAIAALMAATEALDARTRDREARGVEGESKA